MNPKYSDMMQPVNSLLRLVASLMHADAEHSIDSYINYKLKTHRLYEQMQIMVPSTNTLELYVDQDIWLD